MEIFDLGNVTYSVTDVNFTETGYKDNEDLHTEDTPKASDSSLMIVGIVLGVVFVVFFVVGFIIIQRQYMKRKKRTPRHRRAPNQDNADALVKGEDAQEL